MGPWSYIYLAWAYTGMHTVEQLTGGHCFISFVSLKTKSRTLNTCKERNRFLIHKVTTKYKRETNWYTDTLISDDNMAEMVKETKQKKHGNRIVRYNTKKEMIKEKYSPHGQYSSRLDRKCEHQSKPTMTQRLWIKSWNGRLDFRCTRLVTDCAQL